MSPQDTFPRSRAKYVYGERHVLLRIQWFLNIWLYCCSQTIFSTNHVELGQTQSKRGKWQPAASTPEAGNSSTERNYELDIVPALLQDSGNEKNSKSPWKVPLLADKGTEKVCSLKEQMA